MIWVQLAPWSRSCVLEQDALRYYLCWWLRTSSKFSEQEFKEIYRNIGSLETFKQVRIPKHEVVIAMKCAWIAQYLVSDAIRQQEDKHALQQQQQVLNR